jgi:TctA family transporter
MIASHPDLFWGLVASMWIGNVFLLVLNVPMVRYLLSIFKIPYAVLFPAILFFCCVGTYSVNNAVDDIFITAAFGLLGYIFLRLSLDPAPLMLGFILGPMLEENFRRSLLLSRGSFSIFVTRPIAGTLLAMIGLFVAWQMFAFVRDVRKARAGKTALPAEPAPIGAAPAVAEE